VSPLLYDQEQLPPREARLGFIAVDPGLDSMGVAWIDLDSGKPKTTRVRPEGNAQTPLLERVRGAYATLYSVFPSDRTTLVIEEPEGRMTGQGVVVRDEVLKLQALVWWVAANAYRDGWEVKTVRPSKWKGTMPKEVHRRRMVKSWGDYVLDKSPDEIDAMALLCWAMEKIL